MKANGGALLGYSSIGTLQNDARLSILVLLLWDGPFVLFDYSRSPLASHLQLQYVLSSRFEIMQFLIFIYYLLVGALPTIIPGGNGCAKMTAKNSPLLGEPTVQPPKAVPTITNGGKGYSKVTVQNSPLLGGELTVKPADEFTMSPPVGPWPSCDLID